MPVNDGSPAAAGGAATKWDSTERFGCSAPTNAEPPYHTAEHKKVRRVTWSGRDPSLFKGWKVGRIVGRWEVGGKSFAAARGGVNNPLTSG